MIRRTVAAMATALVTFAAVRVAFVEWVRPLALAPAVGAFTVWWVRRLD